MKDLMFSVIIPTLNEELFLPKLLSSLVTQTRQNFEVIVVDGSSKDKTVAVAQTFIQNVPGLKVIVSKKANLPLQRNLGAKEAAGSWLLFVDADSVLLPYFIARVEQFIHDKHPQVFTSWFRPDTEEPNDALISLLGIVMAIEGPMLIKRPNIAPGPFTAILKETFQDVGGYDEEHVFNEDMDIGLRLYQRKVKYAVLRETIYVWSLRRFRTQGTLKVARQYARAALQILVFRRALKKMPGYFMGGHLYGREKKPIKRSVVKKYETKLKRLVREFFE